MSFLARDFMTNSLNIWAEELTKEVYYKWKSKYTWAKSGFKLFYSPALSRPDLMIISFNPGGNAKHFQTENLVNFENGNFTIPAKNEYITRDYHMAKKLQRFFASHMDPLDDSVAFPVLFFRSKDVKSWKKTSKDQRKEVEEFCYCKVQEIMEKIKPKFLLILGFTTYRRLKKQKLIIVHGEKSHVGTKNRPIAYSAKWNDIPVFCMLHPSGARISNMDFVKIQNLFFDMYNNHYSGKQKYS